MNHLLLYLLVQSIAPRIAGRRIGGIRLLQPILSIELTGGGPPEYLVVILSSPGPFCFLGNEDPLAGIGAEAFKRIAGLQVGRVPAAADDRIVRLDLAGGREPYTLAIYLFGSRARVRVERGEAIIESLNAKETGQTLRPGRSPRAPVFKPGGSVVDGDGLEEFREGLIDGRVPFLLATPKRVGGVAPIPVPGMGSKAVDGETAVPVPGMGSKAVDGETAIPVPGASKEAADDEAPAFGPFNDAVTACREVGMAIVASLNDDIVDRATATLRKHLAGRERLLVKLETEREGADSFDKIRSEANTLAAYQSQIPAGASEAVLPDLYRDGEKAVIELDPARSIHEQIDKRFKRAAKLERSREALDKRIQTISAEIGRLTADTDNIDRQSTLREAVKAAERAERGYDFGARKHRAAKRTQQVKEYRRFALDDQWFALVGRSNSENDEITFKVAAPDDFWFHAQQMPGSHVILKSHGAPGNPPDTILEKTAAIAAHFSKARHASLVPVIYTRRKYVRKFRGAKPGQVVCEREKTVFATPGLPDTPKTI